MRYYVLCSSDVSGIESYVVAEVVGEAMPPELRHGGSAAGAIAGGRSLILTRTELTATPDGRRALAEWEAGNDIQHDLETAELALAEASAAGLAYLKMAVEGDVAHPADGTHPARGTGVPSDRAHGLTGRDGVRRLRLVREDDDA